MGLTTYVPVDVSLIGPRLKRIPTFDATMFKRVNMRAMEKCSLSSHPSFPFCVRLKNAEKIVQPGEFLMSLDFPQKFTKTIFITAVNLIVVCT